MVEEPERTSDSGEQWISNAINVARHSSPLITEDVLARMEQLLEGQICEGKLTPTNLKTIAVQLLGDMASKQPEAEEK